MDQPGIDPETALELIQILLHWAAYILAGSALVGLIAYGVFLCVEVFSQQPHSKARIAELPRRVACATRTQETLEPCASHAPIPAGKGGVALSAPSNEARPGMLVRQGQNKHIRPKPD